MTPEQLKKEPFEEIIKIEHEKLDTENRECNKHEEDSTTSQELSEDDSASDTADIDTEESKSTKTLEVHNVCNKTTHHEDSSSEDENVTEIETYIENREQYNGKDNKVLTTNFQVEMENQKLEGLIMYSTEQQIFKFKVNSGNNQELWGVNADFSSYELKWTIHGILQHMCFYCTTENPNVMRRENLKEKSCEYIIIYQDELHIGSTTLEEILHILQDKYKIKINPDVLSRI